MRGRALVLTWQFIESTCSVLCSWPSCRSLLAWLHQSFLLSSSRMGVCGTGPGGEGIVDVVKKGFIGEQGAGGAARQARIAADHAFT